VQSRATFDSALGRARFSDAPSFIESAPHLITAPDAE
jgi:hypothetical protein